MDFVCGSLPLSEIGEFWANSSPLHNRVHRLTNVSQGLPATDELHATPCT